jgi:hypothetical protein
MRHIMRACVRARARARAYVTVRLHSRIRRERLRIPHHWLISIDCRYLAIRGSRGCLNCLSAFCSIDRCSASRCSSSAVADTKLSSSTASDTCRWNNWRREALQYQSTGRRLITMIMIIACFSFSIRATVYMQTDRSEYLAPVCVRTCSAVSPTSLLRSIRTFSAAL